MAIVGEGQGFKYVIAIAVATVLMTLPVYFLELHSPGLVLAQRTDGTLAPVEVRFDHRRGEVRVATILSRAVPERFPLSVHLRIESTAGTLVDAFAEEIIFGERAGVVHIKAPIAAARTNWSQARTEIRFYRAKTKILTVSGRLVPDRTNLVDVTQVKPEAPD